MVAKSFKKCCTSNALYGSEDDLLWDDDKDDSVVNVPSSDYLPSDSDDAGEQQGFGMKLNSLVLLRCHIQVRLLSLP